MRFVVLFALITIFTIVTSAQELPHEWIDPDTGHRVVRLSDEPGSASLYFHEGVVAISVETHCCSLRIQ